MVNWIWLGMIVLSFAAAAANGRMDELTKAAFDGAQTGVTVCFGLISVLVFWMGLMRIGEEAGLIRKLAALLGPAGRRLFPDVPKDHPALGYIMSNMSANLLGLGNAATPMGIKAMQELQKLNPDPKTATPAMCTLLAINTSSITLVPTTLIAIRMSFGSANPAEIVGTTIAATAVATGAALLADRWCRSRAARPPHRSGPPAGLARTTRAARPGRADGSTESGGSARGQRPGALAIKPRPGTPEPHDQVSGEDRPYRPSASSPAAPDPVPPASGGSAQTQRPNVSFQPATGPPARTSGESVRPPRAESG